MQELLTRINSGIEFLKSGRPFKVGDLFWGIDTNGYFNVTGASQYLYFENITREIALKELIDVKNTFSKMINMSAELKKYVEGKKMKFNLDFDYGMGDIRICSDINGIIEWHSSFK